MLKIKLSKSAKEGITWLFWIFVAANIFAWIAVNGLIYEGKQRREEIRKKGEVITESID